MDNWRRSPQALATLIVMAMGFSLLATLSGCGNDDSAFGYVIRATQGENYALTEEGTQQLDRFNNVYNKYVIKKETGDKQLNHFRDAFMRVRVKYVREITDDKLIDAAIKGVQDLKAAENSLSSPKIIETALDTMLASLDPHSSYLNAIEFRETQVNTKGEFGGLGIQVTLDNEQIKVISPIEDTPAFRAGIKSGDIVTHIDGEDIKGKKLMYSVNRMRGVPGTDIRLTILRGKSETFDVDITRAIIKIKSVRWRTEGDIGYLRVTGFNEKVKANVDIAMRAIRGKLKNNLKGIVLDLRNNPGGLLMQSVFLSDAFLEDGRIVSVLGRDTINNRIYEAKSGDLAAGLPLVVLINGGSASASEIVAGALQDRGRATIMGTTSFGKGSVQTITPLPNEGALKLTTQLYYSPNGRAIQARGVEPDIILHVKQKKDAKTRKRESDLPGAIPAVADINKHARVTLEETDCTPVIDKDEKEDFQLGCALTFLNAGSTENFLASIASRGSI